KVGGITGGFKVSMAVASPPYGDTNNELVINDGYQCGYPQVYTNKGVGWSGYQLTKPFVANQWQEITQRVELINDSAHSDHFTMWMDGTQVIDGTFSGANNVLDWGSDHGLGQIYLLTYNTNKDPNQQHPLGQVWYDDLIISTQPIPMTSGGTTSPPPPPPPPPPPSPPPPSPAGPSVSLTSPVNGTTVSGSSVTVSAAVSGTGIAGVQFQLDGQNLGAEVSSSPYSVSWNTTGTANGTHTLSAVARDTSANQAAATESVMVSNSAPVPPPSGPTDITTGLVGYWKFDEASGTTAADSAGSDTGVLAEGATWTAGRLATALSFDGVGGYLDVNDSPALNPAKITLAAWVKPTSIALNGGMVFSKSDGTQYWLRVEPSSISLRV